LRNDPSDLITTLFIWVIYREEIDYTWTDYKTNTQIAKGIKNNTNFGQITGIQVKLDTTCEQNAS